MKINAICPQGENTVNGQRSTENDFISVPRSPFADAVQRAC
jgi:hypothetical protein